MAAASKAGSVFRSLRNVVLVDGCRLPFQPSGTVYNKLVAYDLARLAMAGILTKTGVQPNAIDYVLMGTVIQEAKNQNIARDAGLAAGIPKEVPSHTVTQACISANRARHCWPPPAHHHVHSKAGNWPGAAALDLPVPDARASP